MEAESVPNSRSNTTRFLTAFSGIEFYLRRWTQVDRGASFYSLVERAADNNRVVRRHLVDLKEYADLRNAIVHERGDGRPIAEPYPETAAELERIRDLLEKPPGLLALFPAGHVVTCAPNQRVGQAAKSMLEGNFSQLPVYVGRQFEGLLTTDTIARWLGSTLAGDVGLVEEVPVADVLPFAEDPTSYTFLSREDTVFDALDAFDSFEERGRSLSAILVTHSGAKNESPLSIITIFDMPKLLGAASIGRARRF